MGHTAVKRTSALLLATGLVFGLAACGDDDDDATTEGTDADATDDTAADDGDGDDEGAAGDAVITISGSQFTIGDAAAGEPVSVTNEDGVTHTVTSDDDAWDEVRLEGDASGEITALDAGEYPFHCEIHRSMTGTLEVT